MLITALLILYLSGGEGLKFNNYFGNGMVLEKNVPNKIWGYGTVTQEQVSFSCIFTDQTKSFRSYTPKQVAVNVWEVVTDPQPEWTRCVIEVTGEDELKLKDVLYGDVWICSGQSNMEMNMKDIFNATEEIAYSFIYGDGIRYTTVEKQTNPEATDNLDLQMMHPWAPADDSEALATMSALCFLTARRMYYTLQIPIGLIASSFSGTPIEAWTSQATLDSCGVPQHIDDSNPWWSNSNLWNGMINPLKRVSVKGFLWYQGEFNANYNRDLYDCIFPAMINDWRTQFNENSFTAPHAPFGFVQIAMRRANETSNGYPVIRWHQTMNVGYVPNSKMHDVFMSTALDTFDPKEGYPGNIHPRNKQLAAERLAIAGLNVAYWMTEFPTKGPFPIMPIVANSGGIEIEYDIDFDFNKDAEISGFFFCELSDPDACDSGDSADNWVEIPKGDVVLLNSRLLKLNMWRFENWETGSIAYLWRETPVLETLGLPIYSADEFRLPAAPWKASFEMATEELDDYGKLHLKWQLRT